MTATAIRNPNRKSIPAGARVGIPPRQLNFRLPRGGNRKFFANNGFASLFMATLSGFFPPGEQFFVDSVRHYRSRVRDRTLLKKISGFIGQEAIHGREHDRLNGMFEEQGVDMDIPVGIVKAACDILRYLTPSQQLAATAFMEHFTALLAEQLLSDDRFRELGDADMIPLWMWHALEELEHKSVSYDVYLRVSNSYRDRLVAVPAVVGILGPALVLSMAGLLVTTGEIGNLRENARGARLLFGKNGFVSRILVKMPLFLRRDFHPDQHDTESLVAEWRDKLFGKGGALVDQLA